MKKNGILDEDLFVDQESFKDISTETGKTLSNLVKSINRVSKEIEDTENHLKALKAEKQKLAFETIPNLMDEMGIDRVDVDDATVSLKTVISASIPVDNREKAFSWLRENGLGDIIKNDVTLSFSMGEDNMAKDLIVDLEQRGFTPSSKTYIHPMTLKAFIGERVEKGLTVDYDLFGAFVARTAHIGRK
jgi:seryl-tRNA synthetase